VRHSEEALFDLLIDALSYQGISDQVDYHYMESTDRATWREMQASMDSSARPLFFVPARFAPHCGVISIANAKIDIFVTPETIPGT
jgi:hypothetical protein